MSHMVVLATPAVELYEVVEKQVHGESHMRASMCVHSREFSWTFRI